MKKNSRVLLITTGLLFNTCGIYAAEAAPAGGAAPAEHKTTFDKAKEVTFTANHFELYNSSNTRLTYALDDVKYNAESEKYDNDAQLFRELTEVRGKTPSDKQRISPVRTYYLLVSTTDRNDQAQVFKLSPENHNVYIQAELVTPPSEKKFGLFKHVDSKKLWKITPQSSGIFNKKRKGFNKKQDDNDKGDLVEKRVDQMGREEIIQNIRSEEIIPNQYGEEIHIEGDITYSKTLAPLFASGKKQSGRNGDATQRLFSIASSKKLNILADAQAAIIAGANINSTGGTIVYKDKKVAGNTPLMVAIAHGHLDLAKILLRRMNNINHRNDAGDTALILATRRGLLEIVDQLINQGADIQLTDHNGSTALLIAIATRLPKETYSKLIDQDRTLVDKPNKFGITPTLVAIMLGERWEYLNARAREIDPVKILTITLPDGKHISTTYYILALQKNNVTAMGTYYEKNKFYAARANAMGITPLMIASGSGDTSENVIHPETLKQLLVHLEGLTPEAKTRALNATDASKYSALHYAVRSGNKPLVEWLLAQGAHPNVGPVEHNVQITPYLIASFKIHTFTKFSKRALSGKNYRDAALDTTVKNYQEIQTMLADKGAQTNINIGSLQGDTLNKINEFLDSPLFKLGLSLTSKLISLLITAL